MKKSENSCKQALPDLCGGDGGIRTLVPLRTTAFRERRVTANFATSPSVLTDYRLAAAIRQRNVVSYIKVANNRKNDSSAL